MECCPPDSHNSVRSGWGGTIYCYFHFTSEETEQPRDLLKLEPRSSVSKFASIHHDTADLYNESRRSTSEGKAAWIKGADVRISKVIMWLVSIWPEGIEQQWKPGCSILFTTVFLGQPSTPCKQPRDGAMWLFQTLKGLSPGGVHAMHCSKGWLLSRKPSEDAIGGIWIMQNSRNICLP